MRVTYATRGAPGRANEDYVAAGPDWAIVLDGATAPDGVDSGCVHGVVWLVHQLAAGLTRRLAAGSTAARPLADLLAGTIEETCNAHAATCDLANPDSPSATVAIARWSSAVVEGLVLADSPIVVRCGSGELTVVEDDRVMHLPGGPPYTLELVRRCRNRPGGFWVASTEPAAAYEAVTATVDRGDACTVAMFTDGVTRLVEHYGHSWVGIMDDLAARGPDHLIDLVRAAEVSRPLRGKRHDDATVLFADGFASDGATSDGAASGGDAVAPAAGT